MLMAAAELTQNETVYIALMRDFLNGKISTLPKLEDWNSLLRMADIHGGTGIVFYQLKRSLSDQSVPYNISVKLLKAYADTCYRYEQRVKLLRELDEVFCREKIPYLIFKGIELADMYPMPKLRTMGDTDILVRRSDKERAHKALLSIGCEEIYRGENEWNYKKDNIELELHHRLMYGTNASNTKEAMAFFDTCWEHAEAADGSMRFRLDPSFHMIFVLTHLRKHFISEGVGFRQFMDLAVILSSRRLDVDFIQQELIRLKMWDFARVCFAFCERWFGTEIPFKKTGIEKNGIEEIGIDEAFFLESTSIICRNGIFGTDDPDNINNYLLYVKREEKKGRDLSKGRLRTFFPEYENLCYLPQYAFLQKGRYLLPAAWIYRFIRGLRKTKHIRSEIERHAGITDEQVEKRSRMLDMWKI